MALEPRAQRGLHRLLRRRTPRAKVERHANADGVEPREGVAETAVERLHADEEVIAARMGRLARRKGDLEQLGADHEYAAASAASNKETFNM